MPSSFVFVPAVLAVLCLLVSLTARCDPSTYGPSHTVIIESGTLPEAKTFAQLRLRAGEWAYHFNAGEEAAFFEVEDAANRQWQKHKAELRLSQAYRQRLHQEKDITGREKMGSSAYHDNTQGRNSTPLSSADYFSDRSVRRRRTERLKRQSQYSDANAQEVADARVVVEKEIAALWDYFLTAGASDSANDQQYLGIVERHFSHTFVNRSAAGAFVTAPWVSSSLLHVPLVVVDANLLPVMQHEIRDVGDLWKTLHAKAPSPAASAAKVEEQLRLLSLIVKESKRVGAEVALLARPLVEATTGWVAATLTTTAEAIVANDESTEVKRAKLKQLLKQQSQLRKLRLLLEKYTKAYQSPVRQGEVFTGEATLFALQLIAKQRFGDDVSGLLNAVPTLSFTAPLTGLLEEEWRIHVLIPYAVSVVYSIVFTWVAEELKSRFLSRVKAGRPCAPNFAVSGVVERSRSRARQAFMFISFLELVVPPLLPIMVALVHLRRARTWIWSLIVLMRPSQRVMCLTALALFSALNHVIAVMVRYLFDMVDPLTYRRQLAKKK
ncbi:hypothetical protein JKF63_00096 [Porcisia hertigi]|uniref:Membrane-associated protein n=1 Tax=Porcisia hertigi TaxID=2761500 RepID=A0A836HPD1_9TRYP|nr:hypothetical protein JKF63_00096 [Porcisia hertigi]